MLAEGPDLMDSKFNPLSKILVEYVLLLEARGGNIGFTKEELEELISKIKDYYK